MYIFFLLFVLAKLTIGSSRAFIRGKTIAYTTDIPSIRPGISVKFMTYTGTGTYDRNISLGVYPIVVVISSAASDFRAGVEFYGGICAPGYPMYRASGRSPVTSITGNTLTLHESIHNVSAYTYHVVVLY